MMTGNGLLEVAEPAIDRSLSLEYENEQEPEASRVPTGLFRNVASLEGYQRGQMTQRFPAQNKLT